MSPHSCKRIMITSNIDITPPPVMKSGSKQLALISIVDVSVNSGDDGGFPAELLNLPAAAAAWRDGADIFSQIFVCVC